MPPAVPLAPPAPAAAPPPAADSFADSFADAVKSPMVGTVYLAPEPGAPTFASVGSSVKEGDTVLIIEAMKVMNPIQAPNGGTVTEIFISDAQPVEFGEVLMVIE